MLIKPSQKQTFFSQLDSHNFSQIQVFPAHPTGLALAAEAAAQAESVGTSSRKPEIWSCVDLKGRAVQRT